METPKRWSPNVIADGYNVIADGYNVRHLVCYRKSVPIRKKLKRDPPVQRVRTQRRNQEGPAQVASTNLFLREEARYMEPDSRCAARTHCEIFNIVNQSI